MGELSTSIGGTGLAAHSEQSHLPVDENLVRDVASGSFVLNSALASGSVPAEDITVAPAHSVANSTMSGQDLHGPFSAEDFRPGERFTACCRVDGSTIEHVLQVRRVSPLAIELVAPAGGDPIAEGSTLHLALRMGRHRSRHTGLVVSTRARDGDRELLGIQWAGPANEASDASSDRRLVQRWPCGEDLPPTGVAPNPARVNDTIRFRVRDISCDGLQLVTSLRNKLIVPGMVLESVIGLPTVGQLKLDLEVMNVRLAQGDGKDLLAVGVRVLKPTRRAREQLGQFVLQFGPPTTPEALRNSGLDIEYITRAVDYSYVRTPKDYEQLLCLRKLTSGRYGEAAAMPPLGEWRDIQDGRVRIILARYRGETIGSVRLAFPSLDEPIEHEERYTLPAGFPPRDQMVQISRLNIHPGYRGSDLVMGLFSQGALALLEDHRRYFIGDCAPHLEGLYKKVGAEMSNTTFLHPYGFETRVFLVDVKAGLTGKRLNPIVWNIAVGRMWEHLDKGTDIDRDLLSRGRVTLYQLISPLSKSVESRMKARAAKGSVS